MTTCRICGCSEKNACIVVNPWGGQPCGCAWAEPDLCTACSGHDEKIAGPIGPTGTRGADPSSPPDSTGEVT